jgi:hypothetical protein
MTNEEFEYDVALSFAGEDRATVEKFAKLLDTKSIKYFYDEAEADDLWGRDLIAHLADIYENQARYCIMFISQHYPLKRWTSFERKSIQARAFRDTEEYILPIRLDDTRVPGIAETLGYRDIRQHSLESIANSLEQKLVKAKGQSSTPSKIQDIKSSEQQTEHAPFGPIPIPKRKKTFTQLEKDRFTRTSFNYIKDYFKQGLKELEKEDPDVQTDIEDITSQQFVSKIYVRGDLKAQCSIWLGGSFGPNSINYNEGVNRLGTNAINESITVEDNGEELGLKVGFFGTYRENMATQQQAAEHLWERFTKSLSY